MAARTRTRHGLNAPMVRVRLKGFHAIDRRMVAARSAMAWRRELLDDLGGEEGVSAQRMALVETAVRTRLYLDHLDAWLLEQRSLVNARRKAALPLLRDRQAVADSLSRLLQQLGLDRTAPPPKTLAQVMADIQADKARRSLGEQDGRRSSEVPDPAGSIAATADPVEQTGQGRDHRGQDPEPEAGLATVTDAVTVVEPRTLTAEPTRDDDPVGAF